MALDPVDALRERQLRVTPQRRAILGAFGGRPEEHLSADEVHARAAAAVPELGRGTVYATLAELTELGLLAAVGSSEPVRYEINVEPHQHFRCRLCLRVFDVELPAPATRTLARRGFAVERIGVTVEGVCAECQSYDRGLRDGVAAVHDAPQLEADRLATLACRPHDTLLGPVVLAASGAGLVRIAFPEHADHDALAGRARTRRGSRDARERLNRAVGALDAYLGGGREPSGEAVDWTAASAPMATALEATRPIAYGEHRSYDGLGVPVPAYECGYAMGSNPTPIVCPCHRVTRGAEVPDVYVGGGERRERLLALEQAG